MASVTYDHVTKRFGDVVAVNNMNLQIADKEFLVLVGPSGCGKSTALRMLAGLEEISDGRILIGDRVVNDVPPKDRDIAMVFQSYALYPHMSVYDNMAFGLKLRLSPNIFQQLIWAIADRPRYEKFKRDRAEIDRRVREAAQILGIEHLLDRKPRQLSGGQRQRVAVGRAIVREPAVFLFDEPLSNLDAKLRVQTRAEISKLHLRLGTTFIYVTHDQTEAMTMGTRIAVLKDGVVQQVDTPQNLYDRPGNVFVAGFIGSPSMNFFDATLVGQDGQVWADTGAFRVRLPDEKAPAYRDYLGKQVIFGIRPEDIHDAEYQPSGIQSALVEAQVDVTELMGSEVYLYLVAGGKSFIARVDPRTRARVGNRVGVVLDIGKTHLFDKDTEKAIR